jgi:hypothetical protein
MMQDRSIAFLLLIGSLSVFISCKNEPPISQDNFVKIYGDIILSQDTLKVLLPQTRQNVLSKYSHTENDYNETVKFYNSNPERWQKIFDEVIVYVEKLREPKKQL